MDQIRYYDNQYRIEQDSKPDISHLNEKALNLSCGEEKSYSHGAGKKQIHESNDQAEPKPSKLMLTDAKPEDQPSDYVNMNQYIQW